MRCWSCGYIVGDNCDLFVYVYQEFPASTLIENLNLNLCHFYLKVVEYDFDKLGCPLTVLKSEPFKPGVDLLVVMYLLD